MSGQHRYQGIASAEDVAQVGAEELTQERDGGGPSAGRTSDEQRIEPSEAPESGMLAAPREIAATTDAAKILFTRDGLDTTYVSGRRGVMVLAFEGSSYSVGRYDVAAGEWRTISRGWPRFGNALAFACSVVA